MLWVRSEKIHWKSCNKISQRETLCNCNIFYLALTHLRQHNKGFVVYCEVTSNYEYNDRIIISRMTVNHYTNNGIKKQQTFSLHSGFPGMYWFHFFFLWAFYFVLSIWGNFTQLIVHSVSLFSLPWESVCRFFLITTAFRFYNFHVPLLSILSLEKNTHLCCPFSYTFSYGVHTMPLPRLQQVQWLLPLTHQW